MSDSGKDKLKYNLHIWNHSIYVHDTYTPTEKIKKQRQENSPKTAKCKENHDFSRDN